MTERHLIPPVVITENASLLAFCRHAKAVGYLAVDTEFVRTRTLFAQLGLIQARAGDQVVLIDPLAVTDLEPFWQLLDDAELPKAIHAGGEDYEIFWQVSGRLPQALFDTQVAAAFAGLNDSMGYAALVDHYYQIEVDKSQSRTDWLKRPLSQEQLIYAAADVDYLHDIYPQLKATVTEKGHLPLVLAESYYQAEKRSRKVPPEYLYLFIGNAWQLSAKQLAILRELTAWRQQRAESEDIPLSFIAKEHALIELARREPNQVDQLRQITDLSPVTVRYAGKEILQIIAAGQACAEADLPSAELQRLTDITGYKTAFNAIKKLVQQQAEQLDIPPGLIASRRQINDILHWQWQIPADVKPHLPLPDLFASWRGAMLEQPIVALLESVK